MVFISFLFSTLFSTDSNFHDWFRTLLVRNLLLVAVFRFGFCHFDKPTNDMQHKWNKLCWKSHLSFGDLIYMWFTELFAACFKFILIILCVCLPCPWWYNLCVDFVLFFFSIWLGAISAVEYFFMTLWAMKMDNLWSKLISSMTFLHQMAWQINKES